MTTVAVSFYYVLNWVLFNNILKWIKSLLIKNNAIMHTWQMLTEKRLSAEIYSLLLSFSPWAFGPKLFQGCGKMEMVFVQALFPGLAEQKVGISLVFLAVFSWGVLCIQLAGQVTGEQAVCVTVGCFMPHFLQIRNLIISFIFFSLLKEKAEELVWLNFLPSPSASPSPLYQMMPLFG